MMNSRRSGAPRRVDDTGATLHIVCPEGVDQLGGDELKQCEGWHPARRSEMGDESTRDRLTVAGSDRTEELRALMAERILVLDGATGTMLQAQDLGPDDFGGPELEGCNEILVRTRPDVILDVHRAYLAAGADIIETDTFGGTPLVLAEYGLETEARGLNRLAAELAVEAAREVSTPGKPRFLSLIHI